MSELTPGDDGKVHLKLRVPRDPNGRHEEEWCAATLADDDPELDLALLRFDTPLPDTLHPLTVSADEQARTWRTTAWPEHLAGVTDGTPLQGDVRGVRPSAEGPPELVVHDSSLGAASPLDPHGASGAPVLVRAGDTEVAAGVLRRIQPAPSDPSSAVGGLLFAVPARQLIQRWGEDLPPTNPFQPPLRYFREDDAGTFFGRDDALRGLRAAIRQPARRVVTLLGASGTGKSSLVRAGLIGRQDRSDRWLHSAVIDVYGEAGVATLERFGQEIGDDPALLVLDQFERLDFDDTDQLRTIGELVLGLVRGKPAVRTIIVLRSDYFAVFEANHPGLHSLVLEGLGAEGVVRLDVSRDDLRRMCEGPAHVAGISFQPGVVNTIVNSLLDAHGAGVGAFLADTAPPTVLPLLGITLWQLGERLDNSREITDATYNEIGGHPGALVDWADEAFASARSGMTDLDDEHHHATLALNRVLLRLVRPGAGGPATREFVERGDLEALTEPPTSAKAAITSLVDSGLIYTGAGDDRNTVALMHDALVVRWPRLAELVEEAAPVVRWKHLNFDAEFKASRDSTPDSGRLRDRKLKDSEAYAAQLPEAFSDDEQRFIVEQRRSARLESVRRIAAVSAVVLAVAVLVVVATLLTRQSGTAARNAALAAGNLRNAAQNEAERDPELARALLLEAFRQQPNDENGRSALAEAAFLAPGLVATGSTTGESLVMPDLSQVITWDFTDEPCASVERIDGEYDPKRPYCGSASSNISSLAASDGSRMIAQLSESKHRVRVTVWRRDARKPLWSSAIHAARRAPPGAPSVNRDVAVADNGTVAVAGERGVRFIDAVKRQRIPIGAFADKLKEARVQLSAGGDTALAVTTTGRGNVAPARRLTVLTRRGRAFARSAQWNVKSYDDPALAPDGRSVVAWDERSGWQRFVLATMKPEPLPSVPEPLGLIEGTTFSPSGRLLAFAHDFNVTEVDLSTGGARTMPLAKGETSPDALVANDEGDIVVEDFDRWAYYASSTSRAVTVGFPFANTNVSQSVPSLSADGQFAAFVATGPRGRAHRVEILDLKQGTVTARPRVKRPVELMWQPNGDLLVTRADGTVLSFRTNGEKRVIGDVGTAAPFAVHPTGEVMVSWSDADESTIEVDSIPTHRTLQTIKLDGIEERGSLSFSANGRTLLAAGSSRAAVISNFRRTPRISYAASARNTIGIGVESPVALSSDGSAVAAVTGDNVITVTRTDTGAATPIRLPFTFIDDFALSNAHLAVLGDFGDNIRIFEFDGTPWLHLQEPKGSDYEPADTPDALLFSQAGNQLVTTSTTGLRLQSLDTRTWLSSICATDPFLSDDDYFEHAGVGQMKELC